MENKSVLFVCLGNICRSPSAEAVMYKLVNEALLSNIVTIDSAGTIGYHAGEQADSRMQNHAIRRGYNLTSISRPVDPDIDFASFDMIIGMDDQNINDLTNMAPNDESRQKIHKMTDFCTQYSVNAVPDPYYGGDSGFENVLDILEDACSGLLSHLKNA